MQASCIRYPSKSQSEDREHKLNGGIELDDAGGVGKVRRRWLINFSIIDNIFHHCSRQINVA